MALDMKSMKSGAAKAERIPEGTYMSRGVAVVDLGIQPQSDWKTGEAKDSKPELMIIWELPTERIDVRSSDGSEETANKPRWVSKQYLASSSEMSNLYKLMKKLAPRSTSVTDLINLPVMVSIGSTATGNAKITDVMKAPNGMTIPELENAAISFDFDDPSEDAYLALPAWMQEKIVEADNYSGFADGWEA